MRRDELPKTFRTCSTRAGKAGLGIEAEDQAWFGTLLRDLARRRALKLSSTSSPPTACRCARATRCLPTCRLGRGAARAHRVHYKPPQLRQGAATTGSCCSRPSPSCTRSRDGGRVASPAGCCCSISSSAKGSDPPRRATSSRELQVPRRSALPINSSTRSRRSTSRTLAQLTRTRSSSASGSDAPARGRRRPRARARAPGCAASWSSTSGSRNVRLTTVRIDIGRSTSHLMFAALRLQRKTQALRATSWWSAAHPVEVAHPRHALPRRRHDRRGGASAPSSRAATPMPASRPPTSTRRGHPTGEAIRRANARSLADLFAAEAGKFVCAAAGHHPRPRSPRTARARWRVPRGAGDRSLTSTSAAGPPLALHRGR